MTKANLPQTITAWMKQEYEHQKTPHFTAREIHEGIKERYRFDTTQRRVGQVLSRNDKFVNVGRAPTNGRRNTGKEAYWTLNIILEKETSPGSRESGEKENAITDNEGAIRPPRTSTESNLDNAHRKAGNSVVDVPAQVKQKSIPKPSELRREPATPSEVRDLMRDLVDNLGAVKGITTSLDGRMTAFGTIVGEVGAEFERSSRKNLTVAIKNEEILNKLEAILELLTMAANSQNRGWREGYKEGHADGIQMMRDQVQLALNTLNAAGPDEVLSVVAICLGVKLDAVKK